MWVSVFSVPKIHIIVPYGLDSLLYILSAAYDRSGSHGHFCLQEQRRPVGYQLPLKNFMPRCQGKEFHCDTGERQDTQGNRNKASLKGLVAQCCRNTEQKEWSHSWIAFIFLFRASLPQRAPCKPLVQNMEEGYILIFTPWVTSFPVPHKSTLIATCLPLHLHTSCANEQ